MEFPIKLKLPEDNKENIFAAVSRIEAFLFMVPKGEQKGSEIVLDEERKNEIQTLSDEGLNRLLNDATKSKVDSDPAYYRALVDEYCSRSKKENV